MEVFWTAVRTAPGPCVISDPRAALRASIRAFQRTRDLLASPGRRLVLLRSEEPLLVLADGGAALRRKDGTFCLTPPLLSDTIEVFAPLSSRCLLISTSRAHYRTRDGLTRKIAAKANAGAAAWCQDAVYRLPSMSWPARLQLADAPLKVRAPRLSAVPAQRPPGPPPRLTPRSATTICAPSWSSSARPRRIRLRSPTPVLGRDVTSVGLTGAALADPVRFQLSLR